MGKIGGYKKSGLNRKKITLVEEESSALGFSFLSSSALDRCNDSSEEKNGFSSILQTEKGHEMIR